MTLEQQLLQQLREVTCGMCKNGIPFLDDQPSWIHKDGHGNLIDCRSRHTELLLIIQAAIAAELKAAAAECDKRDNLPSEIQRRILARIQSAAQSALEGMLRKARVEAYRRCAIRTKRVFGGERPSAISIEFEQWAQAEKAKSADDTTDNPRCFCPDCNADLGNFYSNRILMERSASEVKGK